MLTISTKPVVRMSRKHMAWVQVGTVDGHGYDGQQVDTICDICGSWQMIQSTFKPVFRWFWLIGYTYKLFRCLDLDRQTDRWTDYFTPAHARGVKRGVFPQVVIAHNIGITIGHGVILRSCTDQVTKLTSTLGLQAYLSPLVPGVCCWGGWPTLCYTALMRPN